MLELAAVVAAAGSAAVRARARLLPGWSGPPAWIADLVLGATALLGVAELLGLVGLFRELPYVAAMLLLGLATRALLPAPHRSSAPRQDLLPALPAPQLLTAVGLLAAGLLVAHWSIGVRTALDTGITNFDSTWYHGPFAAGFAQGHSTFDLQFIAPQFLAWFYPQNSELLHGIGILAFGRDNLSPLLNLGWMAGTLIAAWCIGRPYGVGPLSMVGAAVVLDAGVLADQAGSMRNDLPAIFFLTAAAALAVNALAAHPAGRPVGRERGLDAGALVVIGLAAGLAAGVKLNYLLPAAGLAAGLVAVAPAGARRRAAMATGIPLIAGCGFWYLRNLVHSGSPLPWLKSLGPLSLPGPDQALGGRRQESVLGYLFDGSVWDEWFLPALHSALGWAWPAVIGLAGLGLVISLGRRGEPVLRVLGLTGLLAAAAWIASPASASGPSGMPLGFESGLRYLAPALILGLALLPIAVRAGTEPLRAGMLVGLIALLAFADASGWPWSSGYLAGAIAAGAVAVLVAAGFGSRLMRDLPRPALAAAVIAVALAGVGAGWVEQRRYLDDRYADPHFEEPGINAAFAWARDLDQERIATNLTRQYPFWGTTLSNRVRYPGLHQPEGGFVRPSSCRQWRRVINGGDYDYVVTSLDRIVPGGPAFPRESSWTRDPNAAVVLRRAPAVVFRVRGPLPARRCAT